MSLEKRDVKVWFDDPDHADLKDCADLDGMTMGEWIAAIVLPVLRKRRHDTIELADRFLRRGKCRNDQESLSGQDVTFGQGKR